MPNNSKKEPPLNPDDHRLDKTTEHSEGKELVFEGLVGLFEHTPTVMQSQASRAVNSALIVRNWLFGWYITEFEKRSNERSEVYGKKLMKKLSDSLTAKLGKGFSRRTLDQFRQFCEQYHEIGQTVFAESFVEKSQTVSGNLSLARIAQTLSAQLPLSWSHYLFLMGVSNIDECRFYEIECSNENWSLRELKRQFNSSLYERLVGCSTVQYSLTVQICRNLSWFKHIFVCLCLSVVLPL